MSVLLPSLGKDTKNHNFGPIIHWMAAQQNVVASTDHDSTSFEDRSIFRIRQSSSINNRVNGIKSVLMSHD